MNESISPDFSRRAFLRKLGVSAGAAPFLAGLPTLCGAEPPVSRQRVVFVFSPNGTIPWEFWPDQQAAEEQFELKRILAPLESYKDRMLILKGVCNRVQGDGDRHMRGMSCLLTGKELFPGNIQGGSDTPAGWCKGISIDQELKNFLQADAATRTRFGSLEFGVGVPDRADPWTRMSYAGPNQPVAPVDDPYRMFEKLYGGLDERESLLSVLDGLRGDLKRVRGKLAPEDRELLERHETFVREMERDLESAGKQEFSTTPPKFFPGVADRNDNIPRICRMQTDLLVNAFANDMTRVSTLQFTRSVGQAHMTWLGIEDGHHGLSHHKDSQKDSQEKLVKINTWFCEQLRYLVERLERTPEPAGDGSMLDHTTVVWCNELGKGNSHTLDDLPFVLIGGNLGFRMGRSLHLPRTAHNRLLLALAHGFGHELPHFGNPKLCHGGALDLG